MTKRKTRARRLNRDGTALYAKFQRTGDLGDITKSISRLRKALEITPEGHESMASRLRDLGDSLESRFDDSGDLRDLVEAISVQHKAVELSSDGDEDMPMLLNNLSGSLKSLFQRTGDLSDLTEAISKQRKAVELTPEGHARMATRLNILVSYLVLLFQSTGDLHDLTQAISLKRKAVDLTPDGHASMATQLNNLGSYLVSLFEHTGDLQDITKAISIQRKAVELTAEGHTSMATRLSNLGSYLQLLSQCTGDLNDLSEAISALRKAVEVTPDGHADTATRLNNLGSSLESLFRRTGDLHDITEAISKQRKAVELTPDGHSDMPIRLNNLGSSLESLFQCTGDLNNLTEAISKQRKAVEITFDGHGDLPIWLNNLGCSLDSLFQRSGNLRDLNEAISTKQKAVELTAEGHSDMARHLSNLGLSLESLFQHTGDLHDLTEAISKQRKAVELTPDGHENMPIRLNSLGSSLESLFERTGDLNDLIETISIKRKAVELTPEGHASMPLWLSNLGYSLELLFHRTGDLPTLTEAVSMQRKAVEITPEGHANMPRYLNNLGYSLESLSQRTGDLYDLTEAISIQRKVVELTAPGHASMASRLGNLSFSLNSLFQRTEDLGNITEAISKQRKAVELTPDGDASMPSRLTNLGSYLESLFHRTGDRNDLTEAISNHQLSALYPTGSPHVKLRGARDWTRLLNHSYPPSPTILAAFDTAIYLITLTASLEQTLQNRYAQLQNSSGITLQAASAALALDRVDKALEWLEQGRCLVWGQLNNLRTPLDNLRSCNNRLAASIMQVSKRLEAAGSSTRPSGTDMSPSKKTSLAEQARDNLNLARQWEKLLEEARAIPGFESFLKPVPWTTLAQHLPESGPVVVINVDTRRCDAIALVAGQDQPLHIPLPDFSLELCTQYREALTAQLRHVNPRYRGELIMGAPEEVTVGRGVRPVPSKNGETVIRTILRGIWEKIVHPILQRLGLLNNSQSSETTLPRIWWCPTGPLSFLPIHAAGIYGKTGSKRLMDYAISSYIPTVAALADRVKEGQSINKEMTGLFMTSQPNVDGAASIPGTTKEVRSIYEVVTAAGVRAEKFEGGAITAVGCLDIMEKYSIVHLACHGYQSAEDPLKSRFLFHDGSLELGTIVQRSLKNADLAFLSACQTSTGVDVLPDEAVHLAAGMLAAGYQRVVATMWSIGDRDAPAVATDFYQYLLDHRGLTREAGLDGRFSAHALHHAMKQLRLRLDDNSDQSLLTWIPYVHFGY
ncbi:hypothetical protein D9611_012588 [Ephemerocybe angulata]|uniref:CHAT domain-containing protein n=1 Tax=Ephemerocybe angulata TaxID=980116 RepID=A0A8H5AUT0_9AGAR|nr:hypothetical protein D9611_012588 [Tulosesus angulatus]